MRAASMAEILSWMGKLSARGIIVVRTFAAEPGAGAKTRLTKRRGCVWTFGWAALALRLAVGYGLNDWIAVLLN